MPGTDPAPGGSVRGWARPRCPSEGFRGTDFRTDAKSGESRSGTGPLPARAGSSRGRPPPDARGPAHDLPALRGAQHGFRERIDGHVLREKLLEHEAE